MTASDLLAIAAKQLGVSESPPNSNNVRYNTWYYGREVRGAGYPWCMVFCQWVFSQAGVALPVRTASCGALMYAAEKAGKWVRGGYMPGDLVIYNFPGGATTDHCGIVESVTESGIVAIEGNTGSGNDADGGQVQRRERPYKYILGAFRPDLEKEQEEEEMRYNTVEECPSWAQKTIRKLVDKGYLAGDGKGLDLSYDMIRMLVINDRAGMYGA